MNILKNLQDGITIFLGIIIEALPFILLGVVLSALLAHYVKEEKLLKLIPKNRFLGILVATLIGFVFPVCECGNVPLARRLVQKGVQPHLALTFLISAPAINPVVIFATWSAFRFMPEIVYLRVIFTFIITWIIGFIFSFHPNPGEMLAEKNDHSHGSCVNHRHSSIFRTMIDEFFDMLKVLIIGALLASLVQVFIPRNIILSIGSGPILSVLAMIFFAFIISVCSNVDSFIALSYVNSFTPGSLLAFLTFGPMIDLKSIFMFRTIFKWKIIFYFTALSFLLTTVLTFFINLQMS